MVWWPARFLQAAANKQRPCVCCQGCCEQNFRHLLTASQRQQAAPICHSTADAATGIVLAMWQPPLSIKAGVPCHSGTPLPAATTHTLSSVLCQAARLPLAARPQLRGMLPYIILVTPVTRPACLWPSAASCSALPTLGITPMFFQESSGQ